MATFVLIHGAWHGGWCWERLGPMLAERGHIAICPDLPGLGQDRTPLAEVSLDLWAQATMDECAKGSEPVILVGHSRGGVVISEAAERAPELVSKLVYLAAFLLPDGTSLLDQASRGEPGAGAALVVGDDGLSSTVEPSAVRRLFYGEVEPEVAERAAARLRPEPMAAFTTPVHVTPERWGSVPRWYVECLRDQALPLSLQRAMVEALPCRKVVSLDTDHSPFFSTPEALADVLDRIAHAPA